MPPKVAVLMAVFEDTRFLSEQFRSIQDQDHKNFEVWISRDCNAEDMGIALQKHAAVFGAECFSVLTGPRKGSSANFLSLIHNSVIQADYFAYADQDDSWERDKLSRALEKLGRIPETVPALYGSRTCLIDENGHFLGLSPLYEKPPSFRNALVQNIFSGNTMVMNRSAREILTASSVTDAPVHDWFTYLLISGAGGRLYYDPYPTVRYRQHDNNLIGSPISLRERTIQRAKRLVAGRLQYNISANIQALQQARQLLTSENQCILDAFSKAINSRLLPRLRGIRNSGVYRQNCMQNVSLFLISMLNRL